MKNLTATAAQTTTAAQDAQATAEALDTLASLAQTTYDGYEWQDDVLVWVG